MLIQDAEEKREGAKQFDLEVQDIVSKGYSSDAYEYMILKDDQRLLRNEQIDYVSEVFKEANGGWVLDLGGGDGWILRYNSSLPIKGVVVDYSRKALELGKHRRGGQNVDFVQADTDFLPFKPGAFKVVFTSGFLHHCAPRYEEMINKTQLMLCVGGQLIIAEGLLIGPERTLGSILFLYYPAYSLRIAAFVILALNNPARLLKRVKMILAKAKLYKPSAESETVTLGDERAQMYPLSRAELVNIMSKYFEVQEIRYYTWLSTFILNALAPIKNTRLREGMISILLPLIKVIDRVFIRSVFKKYSHSYSIAGIKKPNEC